MTDILLLVGGILTIPTTEKIDHWHVIFEETSSIRSQQWVSQIWPRQVRLRLRSYTNYRKPRLSLGISVTPLNVIRLIRVDDKTRLIFLMCDFFFLSKLRLPRCFEACARGLIYPWLHSVSYLLLVRHITPYLVHITSIRQLETISAITEIPSGNSIPLSQATLY